MDGGWRSTPAANRLGGGAARGATPALLQATGRVASTGRAYVTLAGPWHNIVLVTIAVQQLNRQPLSLTRKSPRIGCNSCRDASDAGPTNSTKNSILSTSYHLECFDVLV